ERGLGYQREGFADRRYAEDDKLVPRSQPDALLDEPGECAAQALRLAQSGRVETLCVHGDGPNAVAVARETRRVLEREGLLAPRANPWCVTPPARAPSWAPSSAKAPPIAASNLCASRRRFAPACHNLRSSWARAASPSSESASSTISRAWWPTRCARGP